MMDFYKCCRSSSELSRHVTYSTLIFTAWVWSGSVLALSDLQVKIRGPATIVAGVESNFEVVVYNRGDRSASGTDSSNHGYMIDLFMTKGPMPEGFVKYSKTYADGVLLKGGRISNTRSVAAGQHTPYKIGATTPTDTPAGNFRICARVDSGGKVSEISESNNTSCYEAVISRTRRVLPVNRGAAMRSLSPSLKLQVTGENQLAPELKPVEPPLPVGTAAAVRSVMEDGTIVLAYSDGSQRRLRPDGKTEYITIDGIVMVPYSLQVQGAELPVMPEGLEQWGTDLADTLIAILGNILVENEMQAYLQLEEGKDYYERVEHRLRAIRFLTALETIE